MPIIIGGETTITVAHIPAPPTATDSASTFPLIAINFMSAIFVMVIQVNLVTQTLPATPLTEPPAPPLPLATDFAGDADTYLASFADLVSDVNAMIDDLSLPCSHVTTLPTAPSRGSDPVNFATEAAAFLAALPTLRTELNAFIDALNGASFGALQLSGDMQSGSDFLLLSGDMQSGTDKLFLSGSF